MGKVTNALPAGLKPITRTLGWEARRLRNALRQAELRLRFATIGGIEHLSGPTRMRVSAGEMVVLVLARNAMAHLPTFLAHYERLGAKHIVLMDNGSNDDTVRYASERANVSIFRTPLPFRRFQLVLKRWMVRQFGMGQGWSLVADVDELLDYPFARNLPLPDFLAYLEQHGYDALCVQNLEMVPRESLSELQGRLTDNLEETHRYYDISDIRHADDAIWLRRNHFDADGFHSHTGGVWETVFGYSGSQLTKQPLFRASSGIRVFPYSVHYVSGARIADVTGVFRHYKYTGRFVEHVREELERKQYYGGAEIFQYYRRTLETNPELSLYRPTSKEYRAAEELLESRFLIASPRFLEWVERRGQAGTSDATSTSSSAGDAPAHV